MGMKYSYDEEGMTFYYFLFTLVGLYAIPSTYRLIWPNRTDLFKDKVKCGCTQCVKKVEKKAILKKAYGSKLGWIKYVFLTICWAVMAWSMYSIYIKTHSASVMYDPFEVLGVSPGANEKTIKRAYKVMSLKWHPDKAKDETSKAEANLKFVEINKAYKTLTDETSRKNWEEYGNPDGPTTYSLGIALPSWLVESKNAFWVLALYGLGFGILIPLLVSRSWNSSKKYTKDKILQSTMAFFFKELKERQSIKDLAELVSMAHEFESLEFPWSATAKSTEDTEKLIKLCTEAKVYRDTFQLPKRKNYSDLAKRVFCLLFAQFHRLELPQEDWKRDQVLVVAKAVHLSTGLLKIALVREWTVSSLNAITLGQFLVQAVWESHQPLLQLPHFTNENCAIYFEKVKKPTIRDLLSEDRTAVMDLMNLDSNQKEDILRVSRAYPDVNVLDVNFSILGQEEITPEGITTCVIKLKLSRLEDAMKLDLKKETEKARKEKVDVEQFEFDEDGNMIESTKSAKEIIDPNIALQPIHAPYYPIDKKPFWWIILLSPDLEHFVCAPTLITDLSGEKTVTMQFKTPPRPGQAHMKLLVRSDCLYGADILMDTKFTIVKESKASKIVESDWDISDSESDAGNPFGEE